MLAAIGKNSTLSSHNHNHNHSCRIVLNVVRSLLASLHEAYSKTYCRVLFKRTFNPPRTFEKQSTKDPLRKHAEVVKAVIRRASLPSKRALRYYKRATSRLTCDHYEESNGSLLLLASQSTSNKIRDRYYCVYTSRTFIRCLWR